MSNPISVEIFVEDRAHDAFLVPLLQRIAEEEGVPVFPRVRSARGGHGRALAELKTYQRIAEKTTLPDLLIVGIDANCSKFAKARKEIRAETWEPFSDRLVVACPDPHVERWYLADPASFNGVVGKQPAVGCRKCARDHYKKLLSDAVRSAGHPPTLGGIEFAPELVDAMDLYRAARNDRSLGSFIDDLRGRLRRLPPSRAGA